MTKRIVQISLGELKLCLEMNLFLLILFHLKVSVILELKEEAVFVFCLSSDHTGYISFLFGLANHR